MITENYNFDKFEKNILKLIVLDKSNTTDKIFSDIIINICKKYFSNIKIIIKPSEIQLHFKKKEYPLCFNKLQNKFRTNYINNSKIKILKLIDLLNELDTKSFISFYEADTIENQYTLNNHISDNEIIKIETIKINNNNNNSLIKILQSKYLIKSTLQDLIKYNFLSIDSKSLILTRKAFILSILLSLFSYIPKNDFYSKNKSNIYSVSSFNNKAIIDSVDFGTVFEIINKTNNMSLVKYKKNDVDKVGWIDTNNIDTFSIFNKIFSNKIFYIIICIIIILILLI